MSHHRPVGRASVRCLRRTAVLLLGLGAWACGAPTAPSTTAGSIAFLASTAEPGATIVTGDNGSGQPPAALAAATLAMTFSVQFGTAVSGARLEVELLDAAGQRCADALSDPQDVRANLPVTFTVRGFAWSCRLPASTASATATLLTEAGSGANLRRTTRVRQSFPIAYSYRAFPTPVIASLDWHHMTAGCSGAGCTFPGEPMFVYCGAAEADGAAMTVTLDVTWDGAETQTTSTVFPAGASSLPSHNVQVQLWGVPVTGAAVVRTTVMQAGVNGALPHATATCTAVDVRGESVTKTISVGMR
jgi:hypothetical protein